MRNTLNTFANMQYRTSTSLSLHNSLNRNDEPMSSTLNQQYRLNAKLSAYLAVVFTKQFLTLLIVSLDGDNTLTRFKCQAAINVLCTDDREIYNFATK